jgi:predicted dienelactone hydrolase
MQLFETLLSLVVGLLCVGIATQGKLHAVRFRLFALACCLLAAHLALETSRWQMGTTYCVGIVSACLLLRKSVSHVVLRATGILLALLLLANSVFLTHQLPIVQLPAPAGPYRVGTTSYSVLDSTRADNFADDPSARRELFVEVWYPADSNAQNNLPSPKTLWSELYRGTPDRVSIFLNYMRGIPTHSYPDVPIVSGDGPFPLIIYNHGLQMFTSQNTILMEHLASHGYVVASIGHPYESLRVNLPHAGTVLPPFITSRERFERAMAWVQNSSNPIGDAKDAMKTARTREERAELMLSAIDGASVADIVDVWTKDSQFVLADLVSPGEAHNAFQTSIDFDHVGVMGMSVGGAVAVELCKSDDRFSAGINLDGLAYGSRCRDEIHVPFMLLCSDDGAGLNDFLMLQSDADYYEYHVSNSRHSDFTDFNIAWPIMRTAGQLGQIPGHRMNVVLNQTTHAFMDRYLKRLDVDVPTSQQIPELTGTARVSPVFTSTNAELGRSVYGLVSNTP